MKLLRVRPIIVAIMSVALLANACGSSSDDAEVASINGRVLTGADLDRLLPSGDATVPSRIAEIVEGWLLTQAIEFEVHEQGESINDDDLAEAEEFVRINTADSRTADEETLAHTYALSLAVGRWADAQAAETADPDLPEMLCSSHILLETEDDALAALERYEAGAQFGDLAIELSIGPSGPDGGNLGCVIRGQFVPEFEEAAYGGEAGEVVGPVETQFGFHLIRIESVGPATADIHPDAAPAQLDSIIDDQADLALRLIIDQLELDATANYAENVLVDSSIGTFNPDDFTITPAAS